MVFVEEPSISSVLQEPEQRDEPRQTLTGGQLQLQVLNASSITNELRDRNRSECLIHVRRRSTQEFRPVGEVPATMKSDDRGMEASPVRRSMRT